MEETTQYLPSGFAPIAIQFALAIGFVIITLIVTHNIGPRVTSKFKGGAFESGIDTVGDARTPISIKYFLIAILFVLFDVEIIFMYPWAVSFRQLGVLGYIEMVTFMMFFLAGFYYVIRKGIFKWE